jgi:hypothetical protein
MKHIICKELILKITNNNIFNENYVKTFPIVYKLDEF